MIVGCGSSLISPYHYNDVIVFRFVACNGFVVTVCTEPGAFDVWVLFISVLS